MKAMNHLGITYDFIVVVVVVGPFDNCLGFQRQMNRIVSYCIVSSTRHVTPCTLH